MHLLVLGAFWQENPMPFRKRGLGLNAPSGAGCFLAVMAGLTCLAERRLNAPSGAGCFLASNGLLNSIVAQS